MKVRIRVSEVDIRLGRVNDCFKCPVARAIQRTINRLSMGQMVRVTTTHCWMWPVGSIDIKAYPTLPVSARNFIKAFDEREAVKPFSFTMEL